jgi:hypothetical protein
MSPGFKDTIRALVVIGLFVLIGVVLAWRG